MENASKALIIAAGIFIAILLISMVVLFYSRISTYYQQQHEFTVIEQATKFNAQFEAYNKDNIRGNELISFMNKIIDYNSTESYFEGKDNYKRICVTINLKDNDTLNQFKYDPSYKTTINLTKTITNTEKKSASSQEWEDDKNLIAITNTSSHLCNEYSQYNLNDTKLQQLASNISNIFADEKDISSMSVYNRYKRIELLKEVIGLNVGYETGKNYQIRYDRDTVITESGQDIIEDMKEIASQYYQYTQFKRACFSCQEMIYDLDTNRVVKIVFDVKTDDSGNVVFD